VINVPISWDITYLGVPRAVFALMLGRFFGR
jgi:hypothetical protein